LVNRRTHLATPTATEPEPPTVEQQLLAAESDRNRLAAQFDQLNAEVGAKEQEFREIAPLAANGHPAAITRSREIERHTSEVQTSIRSTEIALDAAKARLADLARRRQDELRVEAQKAQAEDAQRDVADVINAVCEFFASVRTASETHRRILAGIERLRVNPMAASASASDRISTAHSEALAQSGLEVGGLALAPLFVTLLRRGAL